MPRCAYVNLRQLPAPALVALDVLHGDARIIAVIQRSHVYRTERDQSCAFGLKCGEALFTHECRAGRGLV